MTTTFTQRLVQASVLGVIGTAVLMITGLISAPAADAQQAQPGWNPCPQFSIQNVFDDPNSDWDRDRVTNLVELNNGMKPCESDADQFCINAPSLCLKVYATPFSCSTTFWTWAAVNAEPNADWDRDGVTNIVEARNGANPCAQPCPYPTQVDVALNPNADWDRDGVSNVGEVNLGQDPCNVTLYQPCPNWTNAAIAAQPNADWDRDGVTNIDEFYRGTNPCKAPVAVVAPTIIVPTYRYVIKTPTTYRGVPYVAQPPAGRSCTAKFPYYNPATLNCGTRPVVSRFY